MATLRVADGKAMAKAKKTPRTKSGAEITPQIADDLAAEAERGYVLSKAKRCRIDRAAAMRTLLCDAAGHGGGASEQVKVTRPHPDCHGT